MDGIAKTSTVPPCFAQKSRGACAFCKSSLGSQGNNLVIFVAFSDSAQCDWFQDDNRVHMINRDDV